MVGIQRGDLARVIDGPYRGLRGHIDWISDDLVWISRIQLQEVHDDMIDQPQADYLRSLDDVMVCVNVSQIMTHPVDIMLKFTKEKGYDVGVADEVRVARGPHYGLQGVVKNVHFNECLLDLVCGAEEGFHVNILHFDPPGNNVSFLAGHCSHNLVYEA